RPPSSLRRWGSTRRQANLIRHRGEGNQIGHMSTASLASRFGGFVMAPVHFVMRMIDFPLRGLQKVTGIGGMAAFFLAPNMLIFGIFVLLPLVINFVYSMTGGTAF